MPFMKENPGIRDHDCFPNSIQTSDKTIWVSQLDNSQSINQVDSMCFVINHIFIILSGVEDATA